MTTLTRKAVTATTETTEDLGHFSALAATWSLDRQNEQIVLGAFKASIAAWAETGRSVPLHWDHKGEASKSSVRSTRRRWLRPMKVFTSKASSTSPTPRLLARPGGR
jgi:hypothetical protein